MADADIVPVRGVRGTRRLRTLPFVRGRVAISGDGSVIAGALGDADVDTILVTTLEGDELARFRAPAAQLALSHDGTRLVGLTSHDALEAWDVATATRLGRVRGEWGALDVIGELVRVGERAWRLPDLAPVEPSSPTLPECDRAVACTDRFAALIWGDDLVLWDRARDRSVALHRLATTGAIAVVTCGGRFVLAASGFDDDRDAPRGTLRVIELATGRCVHALATTFDAHFDIVAPRHGRHAILSDLATAELHAFDWELDPAGDRDPLATAFELAEPPIVARLAGPIAEGHYQERLAWLQIVARAHPRLELALARRLPPDAIVAWTRRALVDPVIATEVSAWTQLARAALTAGQAAEAADAAAEGLARAGDDPTLHELLERALGRPTVPRVEPRAAWEATARALAMHDGQIVAACDYDVCTWRLDGELVRRFVAVPSLCALAVMPGRIAVGSRTGAIAIYAPGGALVIHYLTAPPPQDPSVSLAMYEDRHAARRRDGIGALAEALAELETEELVEREVTGLRFTPGGTLISAGANCHVEWWPVPDRRAVQVRLAAPISDLDTIGGDAIVVVDGQLWWCARDRQRPIGIGGVTAVATAGNAVLAGCSDGSIRRWHAGLEDGPTLDGHTGEVRAVVVHGDLVASAGEDETVRLWRGDRPIAYGVHRGVSDLAIGLDGTIVSCGGGRVMVWDGTPTKSSFR